MLYLTVHLFVRPGMEAGMRAYESKALGIFRRHGGEVVAAFAPDPGAGGLPDEIQVLRIADRRSFESFMSDPERLAMSAEREAVIRKTEVFLSETLISY